MSVEIKLPDLGENIKSGTVVNVLVKEGDEVAKDQAILELETDKAVLEVPSDKAGIVEKILVKSGDNVKPGQVVFVLTSGSSTEVKPAPSAPKPEKEIAKSTPVAVKEEVETVQSIPDQLMEVKLPDLGEGIKNGTVVNVLVQPGDVISKEQPVVELETDKAVVEVPSPVSGKVDQIQIKAGDQIKIGQVMFTVLGQSAKSATAVKTSKAEPAAPSPVKPADSAHVPATAAAATMPAPATLTIPVAAAPSVRRFAREIGIDINKVKGTNPGGRISIEDVKYFSKQLNEQRVTEPASGIITAVALPDFSKWGEVERTAMNKVREITATHLSTAWSTIPHVTQFDKADITDMEKLRKQFAKKAEDAGGKLTMTAILLKICAAALKVFPQFNASVDMQNLEIVYKKYINVGVAVDTDRGLLVPVIRNVDEKNIVELSVELSQIAQKARDKKLSLDDMQGGNFTISNLGGIGGTAFTPIVNAPEVAILGVSRSNHEPVYENGEFTPRLMLPLSLSYDHRVIDGADGARFTRWIVDAIEQPFKIVLEG